MADLQEYHDLKEEQAKELLKSWQTK